MASEGPWSMKRNGQCPLGGDRLWVRLAASQVRVTWQLEEVQNSREGVAEQARPGYRPCLSHGTTLAAESQGAKVVLPTLHT